MSWCRRGAALPALLLSTAFFEDFPEKSLKPLLEFLVKKWVFLIYCLMIDLSRKINASTACSL